MYLVLLVLVLEIMASYDAEIKPLLGNSSSSSSSLSSSNKISYYCYCIPYEISERGELIRAKNSVVSAVFLLVNTMIGSGILIQPYVFKMSGIGATILEYIIIAIMTHTGVDILIISADKYDRYNNKDDNDSIWNYAELAVRSLGTYSDNVVDLLIVIGSIGEIISYLLIIGTLMISVISTYTTITADQWYYNESFLIVMIVVFLILPFCLIRTFGHTAIISYVSITVITGVALLVIVGGPIIEGSNNDALNWASFSGSVQTIGSIVFAFQYTSAIFHCYSSLETRNVITFSYASIWATSLGVSLCFLVGLMGYLTFRDETDVDILENFTDTIGAIFKLAVVIHLIFYIPGVFIIMRSSLLNFFQVKGDSLYYGYHISVTLLLLGIVTVTSCLLQIYEADSNVLAVILDLTGGITGSSIGFIIPALIGKLFINININIIIHHHHHHYYYHHYHHHYYYHHY